MAWEASLCFWSRQVTHSSCFFHSLPCQIIWWVHFVGPGEEEYVHCSSKRGVDEGVKELAGDLMGDLIREEEGGKILRSFPI